MALDILAPVAGLVAGPATEATVRAILNVEDDRDDARLTLNINGANMLVVQLRKVKGFTADVAADADPLVEWPQDIILGASLLAARWFKRSNSPAGVIDLGGEAGVAYVQRNDPDIGMMLGLGPYSGPAVG